MSDMQMKIVSVVENMNIYYWLLLLPGTGANLQPGFLSPVGAQPVGWRVPALLWWDLTHRGGRWWSLPIPQSRH